MSEDPALRTSVTLIRAYARTLRGTPVGRRRTVNTSLIRKKTISLRTDDTNVKDLNAYLKDAKPAADPNRIRLEHPVQLPCHTFSFAAFRLAENLF